MNRNRVVMLGVAIALVFAAALAARFFIVEPRGAELVCSGLDAPGWCPIRKALVPVFTFQIFGLVSLIAGGFAVLRRRAGWGTVALLCGAAGMVLYNVEMASIGTVLGLVAVTRLPPALS